MASASVDLLSAACAHLTRSPEEREADHRGDETRDAAIELDTWDAADWRAALLDVPLDERAYADRFGIERSAEMDRLWAWWSDRTDERVTHATTGYLGFFLLTLISMHRSDRMRYHGESYGSSEIADRPGDELCGELVAHPYVQHAIEHLYAPSEEDDEAAVWDTIDFATMAFHRQGTTSIIVKVDSVAPKAGDPEEYALKCLIYPYLRMQPIVEATRGYKREFGGKRPKDSPLVTVWDSYDSWVLMRFVEGKTLSDHLRETAEQRRQPKSEILRPVDIKQLRALGMLLLDAMGVLAENVGHHNDLTPSNIIVRRERHSLQAQAHRPRRELPPHPPAPRGRTRRAGYVAPEVKADGDGGQRADLYSVGMVLIAIGGIPHTRRHGARPVLRRLGRSRPPPRRPARRRSGPAPDRLRHRTRPCRFKEIRDLFVREIEVLEAAEYGKPRTLRSG